MSLLLKSNNMKKLLLNVLVLFFASVVFAQEENVLYILNGNIVSKEVVDKLNPDLIKGVRVATGFDRAMVITTGSTPVDCVNREFELIAPDTSKSSGSDIYIRESNDVGQKMASRPLYVIKDSNGRIFSPSDSLVINPEQIKSMIVIRNDGKSVEKFRQYGDVSKGVIFIELK